ncbi:unnamed protein product [Orchesella dallaii]|uniref:Uncharacterized protein n=1 Tax=Orchesella dallaii TaxID=48710 RepID=A0ABP1S373_9HEXA
MAAKIASCQLSGDIRNIQGFLWNNVPDFNRGLYMKLLGNLNHFMYFLPPDMIQFEDMFYILHLLMSAGVEVHLQKEAESRKNKSIPDISKPSEMLISDEVYYQNRDDSDNKFPGTNLDMDRNYLAVSRKTGLHFVISPTSSHELTIASFGHTQTEQVPGTERTSLPYTEVDMDNFLKQTTALTQEMNAPSTTSETKKKIKKKKSKHKKAAAPPKPTLDPTKVARITANNAIESAVEYAQTQPEYTEKVDNEGLEKAENDEESPVQSPIDNTDAKTTTSTETERKEGTAPTAEVRKTKSVWEKAPMKDLENMVGGDGKNKSDGFNAMQPNGKEKRFIACEEQWFDDIHDKSVIQALLECPALLAINESGALDLSKWVEKYLFSYGMDIGGGEGILLGDLKNWNFVEELVPIQTVQMLNEATQDYLSMQRMYCPFYDTLLFIFNNPSPKELTAETQFYLRLKTLPGLQHFLEYTMNDKDVLKWIEAMDSTKRLEMGETCNINTLLNIIPEEQWLLVPSIKYQIMVENARHSVGKNLPPLLAKGAEVQSPPNKPRKSPESTKTQRNSLPVEIETDETQEVAVEVPDGVAQQGSPLAESAKTRRDVQNPSSSNNNSKGIKFEENPRGSKDGGGSLQSKRKSDDKEKDATPGTGSSGEQGPKRPSENDEEKMAAMQAAANALAFPEDSRPSG